MAKRDTKELILVEAFKLFTTKPYDKVTFLDLENVTELSRGAILYHVHNKETLFKEVVDKFLFGEHASSLYGESTDSIPTLSRFLRFQIEQLKTTKKQMHQALGIKNINIAYMNIITDALFFYPGCLEKGREWFEKETRIWRTVVDNAVSKQEINETLSSETVTSLLLSIYYGSSSLGILIPKGIDPETLKRDFMTIYDLIKA